MRGPLINKALPPTSISVARKPRFTPLGCVTAKPRSRRSITALGGGSTRRCPSSWPPAADRGAPRPADHWAVRRRQVVAALALAQKACRDGYTVRCARGPRLFADLDLATAIRPRERGSAGRGWDDLRADRCVGTRGVVGGLRKELVLKMYWPLRAAAPDAGQGR